MTEIRELTVYLAGPMTGYPDFNFPAFNVAAARWREKHAKVINPAELDGGKTGEPWEYYLRRDIPHLLSADAVAVLPGWRQSRGARLEVVIAEAMGMPLFDAEAMSRLPHETILDEAKRLVGGDRGADYGPPAQDYARTAKMWTGVLLDKLRDGEEVMARDAMLCMIAVKMSREAHRHKRDNLVDIAGYAYCIDEAESPAT